MSTWSTPPSKFFDSLQKADRAGFAEVGSVWRGSTDAAEVASAPGSDGGRLTLGAVIAWQHRSMSPPMTYTTTVDGLSSASFAEGFFERWAAPPTPEEHLELLSRATHVSLALLGQTVVGYATALSDGLLAAYIPLLEVLPEHRRRGVGTQLVKRLMRTIGPVYMIDVMCDADVLPFYRRLGFRPAGGAVVRNYDWRTADC